MGATPVLSFAQESGAGVHVDLERLISSRLLIQADSGGGKSRLLRSMCEQLHGRVQIIVLDPEGEFATLREKYPYLLAGRDGDVATDPKTAKMLARRLMELGASAVIDLYDLKLHDRRRYVRLFLDEIMNLPRRLWRPLLIPIDEAHVYCPQGAESEASDAVITLCTQGRKRGYAAVLATQRISKLHKDAAAELKNRLIGSTGLDLDMKRAGDDLGFDKEQRLALRQLDPGTFWAYGPAISREPVLVRSAVVQTTHPTPGAVAAPSPPPPAAVRKMLEQMQGLEREAEEEARSIEDLQRQLAAAKTQVRKLERGVPAVAPVADEKAISRAVGEAERPLQSRIRELERELAQAVENIRRLADANNRVVGKFVSDVQVAASKLLKLAENSAPAPLEFATRQPRTQSENRPTPPARTAAPRSRPVAPSANGSALPVGEHAVLTAACQYPDGVTREQITILTGYKRSTRDAYIVRLRAKELVDVAGDRIVAADGAEGHLGDFEPLPTRCRAAAVLGRQATRRRERRLPGPPRETPRRREPRRYQRAHRLQAIHA